jgi:hypothetical protein
MGKFGVLRQNDAKRLGAKIGRHVPGGGIDSSQRSTLYSGRRTSGHCWY